jgi:hypothetical protein
MMGAPIPSLAGAKVAQRKKANSSGDPDTALNLYRMRYWPIWFAASRPDPRGRKTHIVFFDAAGPRVEEKRRAPTGSERVFLRSMDASVRSYPYMRETVEGNAGALKKFEQEGYTIVFGPSSFEACLIKLGVHLPSGGQQDSGANINLLDREK